MRYFVSVVNSRSFSRAATTIHVAQPALSRQILELEEIIGIELLHRTPRGVRTTVAGEVLYREASAILSQMDRLPDLVRSAGGDIEGTVVVGMSSTLAASLAGPIVQASNARYPKIKLRLITGDSILLKSRMDTTKLDLAIVFEDVPSPGYNRQPLFRQRLYLIQRESDADSSGVVSWERLAELPLILPALPNVTRILLDRAFAEAGIAPNKAGEADVLSSMLSVVASGMAHTILPKGDFSNVPGYESLMACPIEPAIFLTASIINSTDAPLSRPARLVHRLLTDFVFNLITGAPPPGAQWIGGDPPLQAK
ncbi:MAG TPA: LysR substrate-binding domain-containing protein [Acetobacteraceae bacterium]|nr:LysR substrate-binding domain-containing protein [Acetobacteraceae bacterium]